jgi:phosphoserine phosphatase
VPLFVDLDGTLVRTDVSVESAFALVRRNLGYAVALPLWLLRGRAHLKRRIAERVTLDVDRLPYIEDFIGYLRDQRATGRRLILMTAADDAFAQQVSAHLGIFDDAFGSDGRVDLAGKRKLGKIRSLVADGPFDYAGDDIADLRIFPHARRAIVVEPVPAVAPLAKRLGNLERTFDAEARKPGDILRALRPLRWIMNLLVLLPLAAAGEAGSLSAESALAILSFCLAASGAYAFDDLLHLPVRRRLPPAERGAIAAGAVSIERAGWAILVLWVLAFGLAAWLPGTFVLVLAGYIVISILAAQDWYRAPRLVPAMALSALRIAGGAALLSVPPTLWSLALGAAAGGAAVLLKRPKLGLV